MADCAIFLMLDVDKGLVLMENRPDQGDGTSDYWLYPGGKVEPGETYWNAAAREMTEETGCVLTQSRPFSPRIETGNGWASVAFLVTGWIGQVPTHTMGDRKAALKWVDPHEIAALGQDDGRTAVLQLAHRLVEHIDATGTPDRRS